MGAAVLGLQPDILTKTGAETSGTERLNKNIQVSQSDKDASDQVHDTQISHEEISKAIEEINKTLTPHDTRLEFSIHDRTKEIMVKVVDEKTGEIIREVPPKKVLDMVAMAWDELGLLVDEKA